MDREWQEWVGKALLDVIAAALTSVTDLHYYEDERGFQGEYSAQLRLRLRDMVLPEGALLREDDQKKLAEHGLRIRPDIILHEPFDPGRHRGRDEGNHVVMDLKRRQGSGPGRRKTGRVPRACRAKQSARCC